MTDTVTLKEAQQEIQQKMAAMKQELQTLGEKLFRSGAQDVFDTYPQVQSFSWTQYTPYFNDGEECVFGVNDYFTVTLENGEELEDVYDSPYWRERKVADGRELDLSDELGPVLSGLINTIDSDTMKALFGDHVRVTVTREGIETDYYDHE